MDDSNRGSDNEVDTMWALITGGFIVVMTVLFSLGKGSSKREEAARSHRQELLARSQANEQEATVITSIVDEAEQPKLHKERKAPRPSEQL